MSVFKPIFTTGDAEIALDCAEENSNQDATSWFGILRIPANQVYSESTRITQGLVKKVKMEVTKALAALQPLYGKGNVEIGTADGHRVRGVVRSMKTTQALTTPSVKVERADGEVVKIPFPAIVEIINHNRSGRAA